MFGVFKLGALEQTSTFLLFIRENKCALYRQTMITCNQIVLWNTMETNCPIPIPSVPPQSADTNSILREPSLACELPSREWAHRYWSMSCSDDTIITVYVRARTHSPSSSFLNMLKASKWCGMNQMLRTCFPSLVRSCRGRDFLCLWNQWHVILTFNNVSST